jgi:hypothetical protein
MGLNEDLGDRENIGNASVSAARARELPSAITMLIALSYENVLKRALELCNESRNRHVTYEQQESKVEDWISQARQEIKDRFEGLI